MLDRWLFIFPDRKRKLKSGERGHVSDQALEDWSQVARRIWERQMNAAKGRPVPHVVHFTDAGKQRFNQLYDEHVDEMNVADFPEYLLGPWSKFDEYAGRLALVLTVLRHAADPTANPQTLPQVGPDIAEDAWKLVNYFKTQHRRMRAHLHGDGMAGVPEGAKWILNWIRNHPGQTSFSGRDLTLSYPPSRDYDPARMDDGLQWLQQRNAIRRAPMPERAAGRPGRKPATSWLIHPDLHGTQQNQHFQQNGQAGGGAKAADGGSVENVDSVARNPESDGQGPEHVRKVRPRRGTI
jgi:hypothetical protein